MQPPTPLLPMWMTLHLNQPHCPPPAPNFLKMMTTLRAAQTAQEEQLKALQQIE
jgi:hypothetical protein